MSINKGPLEPWALSYLTGPLGAKHVGQPYLVLLSSTCCALPSPPAFISKVPECLESEPVGIMTNAGASFSFLYLLTPNQCLSWSVLKEDHRF